MSDARYSSSDIPNFDTYPSTPLQADSLREGQFDSAEKSGLEIKAARLGSALGQFVLMLRSQKEVAGQKLSVISEAAGQKLSGITEDATAALSQTADSVKARAGEAGQAASNKAQEIWTETERRAEQLRERAVLNLKRAQVRAQEFQRDKPEHVAIGVGALGLAVGIGLRIWRANRA